VSGITEEDKKKTTQLISHYKEGREIYKLKEPRNLFAKLHHVPIMQTRKKMPLWLVQLANWVQNKCLHSINSLISAAVESINFAIIYFFFLRLVYFRPMEVECVPITHKLLRTPPPFMEPFHERTSDVVSPKIRSTEKRGTTIYSNPRGPEKYVRTTVDHHSLTF